MKKITAFFLFFLFVPSFVLAGEIYGTITTEGRPVGQGIDVRIEYGGNNYDTKTDNYGSYRAYIQGVGKGILRVYYREQSPTTDIFSYERSARYDLVLEKDKDGKYSLRRN
jgi:hypothetical protein